MNIKSSDEYNQYLDWLIEGLKQGVDAHALLFSSFVLQTLISELIGANKIDVATRVLNAIDASTIGNIEEDISELVNNCNL